MDGTGPLRSPRECGDTPRLRSRRDEIKSAQGLEGEWPGQWTGKRSVWFWDKVLLEEEVNTGRGHARRGLEHGLLGFGNKKSSVNIGPCAGNQGKTGLSVRCCSPSGWRGVGGTATPHGLVSPADEPQAASKPMPVSESEAGKGSRGRKLQYQHLDSVFLDQHPQGQGHRKTPLPQMLELSPDLHPTPTNQHRTEKKAPHPPCLQQQRESADRPGGRTSAQHGVLMEAATLRAVPAQHGLGPSETSRNRQEPLWMAISEWELKSPVD